MKALNQWARYYGYNDFDTFIRAGGSRREAYNDISKRIRVLQQALDALIMLEPSPDLATKPTPILPPDTELEESLQDKPGYDLDAIIADDPPNPDNAHVQGAEHAC